MDVKGCGRVSWPGSTSGLNLSGPKSVQQRPKDLQSDSGLVRSASNSASTEFGASPMEAGGVVLKKKKCPAERLPLDCKATDQIYSASIAFELRWQ